MLLLHGCPAPCEGADCSALYPRARLGLFHADSIEQIAVDPRDPDAAIEGADADGFDWALAGREGGVLAGIPAAGELRAYTFGLPTPVATHASAVAGDRFGAALGRGVGSGGGVRLVVGAPGAGGGTLLAGAGAVYVYEDAEDDLSGLGEPAVTVLGAHAEDHLGEGAWACGDLDGDGVPDWAATAPWASAPAIGGDGEDAAAVALAGAVYLALSSVLPAGASLSADALPALHGGGVGAGFGASVACGGSFDGDGVAELIVGAPGADAVAGGLLRDGAGAVSVHLGGAGLTGAGPGDAGDLLLAPVEPAAGFGGAIAVGDLDGDGVPELVVGAPGADAPGPSGTTVVGDTLVSRPDDVTGAVYVYAGKDVAAELAAPDVTADPVPFRTLHGSTNRGRFGASLLVADLDGDGVGDLVVGAPGDNPTDDDGGTRAGAATVWRGPLTDWPETQLATEAATTVTGARQYLETGRVLASTLAGESPAGLVILTRSPSTGE